MIGARLLALWSIALLPVTASAQSDDARARQLFEEGVALAKQQSWSEALARFEASRDLRERPSTVFNIGTTLMRLERPKAAIETFERFIAISDSEGQRRAAEELLAEARASLVNIDLTIEPANAQLRVDGELLPANGPVHHLVLDPGDRTFEVTADGFGALRESIRLAPGAQLVRAIALEPNPPPPAPALPPPPAPLPSAPVVESEREQPTVLESPWFWVVTGVVVIGAAVGLGVGLGVRRVEDPSGGTAMDVIRP